MIANSELILNPDGSVYHLNLLPEHIADTFIFVGDQNRVEKITRYFEHIEFSTQKREFKAQTGTYKGKRITVLSTGIGPDNIDIVLNELDALVNVDLKARTVNSELKKLKIIRVGTSGALQPDIPVNSFVVSRFAVGTDNMLRSYVLNDQILEDLSDRFVQHTAWDSQKGKPYAVSCSSELLSWFDNPKFKKGITATAGGFYGPQGREVRLTPSDKTINEKLQGFSYEDIPMTNLEMETAAIYGLSALFGHEALSLNAIIANRANGTFSENPEEAIENLIQEVLAVLAKQ